MAVDERARHEPHRKLEEVLGPDQAATLMAHLPPVGWADVATKHDQILLKGDLAQLEGRMLIRFDAQDARFDSKLDQLRAEMYKGFARHSRVTIAAVLGSVTTVASLIFAARLV